MAGVNPGDKLTAALLNDNFMCRTEDTSSVGSIETDKFFIDGKRDEASASAQALVADVGVINIIDAALGSAGDAASLSAGVDGQGISIVNGSSGNYTLTFLIPEVVLSPGEGLSLVYCATNAAWLPTSCCGGDSTTCDISGASPGVPGVLVYQAGGGWTLADPGAEVSVATHMIVATNAGGFSVQAVGPVTLPAHGYTVGDTYYADVAVPGGVTNVKPSGSGQIINPAFNVISADKIELMTNNDHTLITAAIGAGDSHHLDVDRSSTQGSVPSGTFTTVLFNSVNSDIGGNYNVATGEYVVPAIGIYDISANVNFRANFGFATGSVIRIMRGSNTIMQDGFHEGASSNQTVSTSTTIALNTGDVIRVDAEHNSGGNRDITTPHTNLRITKVGEL